MNSLLVISFLNEFELIWKHIRFAILSAQLNGINYCDQTQIFYLI